MNRGRWSPRQYSGQRGKPKKPSNIPRGLDSKVAEATHQLMLASSESSPTVNVPVCAVVSGRGQAQLTTSTRTPSINNPSTTIQYIIPPTTIALPHITEYPF